MGITGIERVFADTGADGLAACTAVTEFKDGDRLVGATGLVAKLFIA